MISQNSFTFKNSQYSPIYNKKDPKVNNNESSYSKIMKQKQLEANQMRTFQANKSKLMNHHHSIDYDAFKETSTFGNGSSEYGSNKIDYQKIPGIGL